MKFTLLDIKPTQKYQHQTRNTHDTYSDKYQYLDDLLDKTYLTDYFMDKSTVGGDTSSNASLNK